jgi:hypothetical protein
MARSPRPRLAGHGVPGVPPWPVRPDPPLDSTSRGGPTLSRGAANPAPPVRARPPASLTRARHGGAQPGLAGAAPGVPGAPCVPALASAARLRVRRGALARPLGPASPARRPVSPAPPASPALSPARPSRPAPGLGVAAWRARGRPAQPARARSSAACPLLAFAARSRPPAWRVRGPRST